VRLKTGERVSLYADSLAHMTCLKPEKQLWVLWVSPAMCERCPILPQYQTTNTKMNEMIKLNRSHCTYVCCNRGRRSQACTCTIFRTSFPCCLSDHCSSRHSYTGSFCIPLPTVCLFSLSVTVNDHWSV